MRFELNVASFTRRVKEMYSALCVRFLCSSGKRNYTVCRAGFSVLEIILVLLLIGIMGALATPLFSRVAIATVSGAVDQQAADEAYWAAARMTSILGIAVTGDASTANELEVGLYDSDASSTNYSTFAFADNQITLDGVLFWDDVASFSASYSSKLFEVDIRLVDEDHPLVSLDGFARNAK